MDYRVWALLMKKLGRKRYTSVKQLMRAIKEAWNSFTKRDLRNIIKEFRMRLEACIAAGGGNFEHLLEK